MNKLNHSHKPAILAFSDGKESLYEKNQLSLDVCKKILEKSGGEYTDEQVLKIRQLLYKVGNLEYYLFNELKKRCNGKYDSIRTGKHGRTSSQRNKHSVSKGENGAILLDEWAECCKVFFGRLFSKKL